MIRRRDFVTLLGGAAAAWPLAARAQQPAMPTIGVLLGGAPELLQAALAGFRRGLAESGYVEVFGPGEAYLDSVSPCMASHRAGVFARIFEGGDPQLPARRLIRWQRPSMS